MKLFGDWRLEIVGGLGGGRLEIEVVGWDRSERVFYCQIQDHKIRLTQGRYIIPDK